MQVGPLGVDRHALQPQELRDGAGRQTASRVLQVNGPAYAKGCLSGPSDEWPGGGVSGSISEAVRSVPLPEEEARGKPSASVEPGVRLI